MNIRKEIKTIFLPVLKGLPLTIVLVALAFMLTRKMVIYTNPIYQAEGAIRIDLQDHSSRTNSIFEDEKSNGSSPNFLTEVETFKSKSLIRQTLKNLAFQTSYYRVGELKTVELYEDCPFYIAIDSLAEKASDKDFYLKYLGTDSLLLSRTKTFEPFADTLFFNRPFQEQDLGFTIKKAESIVVAKPNSLHKDDVFMFRFNSLEALQESVNSSNLFIKPVDKEIQVIKVYYQHEVPQKAALFVDALMQTYIDECKNRLGLQTDNTLSFIDEQLLGIRAKLKTAEGSLAAYKAENGLLNSKQKMDATLKEVMQLDLQKVNYGMQEEELSKLFDFLATGNDLQEFAPNFESLNDAVFRDAYLQVQKYELQKMDLLQKYTPQSQEVTALDNKIKSLRTFVHESVKNTLATISHRRTILESNIASINSTIETLPNKEKQIIELEREVKLNENLYNSMMDKRMKLAISKTASVIGHQIIDPAQLKKHPIWPNKALIYGVAVFFALIIGILLSFALHYLLATVKSKEDLAEICQAPIIGTVKRNRKKEANPLNAFAHLYTNVEILKQKQADKGMMIATTSLLPQEGKTCVAVHLAKALASVGKKVLLLDMDIRKPELQQIFEVPKDSSGLSGLIKGEVSPAEAILSTPIRNLDMIPAGQVQNLFSAIIFSPSSIAFLKQLKSQYDYILMDMPPVGVVVDAIPLMHQSDFNLFVVRSGYSKTRKAKRIPALLEEFQIPNTYMVLNSIPSRGLSNYYATANKKQPWWQKSIFKKPQVA